MTRAKGDDQTKYCNRCERLLPIGAFYRNTAREDGLSGYCAECQNAASAAASQKLRAAVLAYLGGRCSSPDCRVPGGMDDPRALQVDHVEGGGREDRSVIGVADTFLRAVLKADPGKYQLLCANCNAIKRIERREHRGKRVYTRNPPTERKLRRQQEDWKREHGERTRTYWAEHPEELVERNRKIAEARRGKNRALTDKQVAEILRRLARGETQTALAREFGVSQPLISKLIREAKNS